MHFWRPPPTRVLSGSSRRIKPGSRCPRPLPLNARYDIKDKPGQTCRALRLVYRCRRHPLHFFVSGSGEIFAGHAAALHGPGPPPVLCADGTGQHLQLHRLPDRRPAQQQADEDHGGQGLDRGLPAAGRPLNDFSGPGQQPLHLDIFLYTDRRRQRHGQYSYYGPGLGLVHQP